MTLTDEQISLLNVHVAYCDSAIKTITAKVRSQKREDLFCDVSTETKKVISLMVQISDCQTAAFYSIRNNDSAAVAA
jgi:hypothetical protein